MDTFVILSSQTKNLKMRFPKSILSAFCAVLFFTTLSAQNNLSEGYYVGFKKDTVRGFFNFDNLATHKVLFYASKMGSVSQKLTPDNVQQIETSDKSIRIFIYSYKDQKEPLFINKYVDGNVALYKSSSLNPEEPDVFFISSVKMPLIRKISAINPKAFLNTYFKGCELGTNFSVKYAENSLLAAVAEISNCAYPSVEFVKKSAKKSKITMNAGVQTALFVNHSKVKGWLDDQQIKTSISPLLGVIVGFNISNSIKLYTGLNYFNRNSVGKDSLKKSYFTNPTGWVYLTQPPVKVSTDFLEIPIALHYEFNKNNPIYIPKLILGVSLLTPLKTKYQEYFNAIGKYVDASNGLYASSLVNPSFLIGGGVKKMLKNKSSIELNMKYTFETDDPVSNGRFFSNRYILSFNYLLALGKKE
jgi:Outer membrane protein beta-barrel domain